MINFIYFTIFNILNVLIKTNFKERKTKNLQFQKVNSNLNYNLIESLNVSQNLNQNILFFKRKYFKIY